MNVWRTRKLGGSTPSGITFYHPVAFWLGSAAMTLGVVLHLPMYLSARAMWRSPRSPC